MPERTFIECSINYNYLVIVYNKKRKIFKFHSFECGKIIRRQDTRVSAEIIWPPVFFELQA